MTQSRVPQVVLTGADGYLGAWVVAALEAAEVRVSSLQFRSFVRGVDEHVIRRVLEGADVICHLAGTHPHQPGPPSDRCHWAANVGGTRKLLDAIPARCRVVYASSAMAGSAAPRRGADRGRFVYASSKRAAEMLVSGRAGGGGSGVSLRLQALAGAHRSPSVGLIGVALRAARDGTPLKITRAAPRREYLHVADAASAVVAACLTPFEGHTVVDIGSGIPQSVAAVVAAAERVTGQVIVRQGAPPRVEPAPRTSDLTVAAALLAWSPRRSDLDRIVADQWEDMRRQELRDATSPTGPDHPASR
jgi:nucleoside-diphosphate-sugar epimerase